MVYVWGALTAPGRALLGALADYLGSSPTAPASAGDQADLFRLLTRHTEAMEGLIDRIDLLLFGQPAPASPELEEAKLHQRLSHQRGHLFGHSRDDFDDRRIAGTRLLGHVALPVRHDVVAGFVTLSPAELAHQHGRVA